MEDTLNDTKTERTELKPKKNQATEAETTDPVHTVPQSVSLVVQRQGILAFRDDRATNCSHRI
jgi:hypothetical protein